MNFLQTKEQKQQYIFSYAAFLINGMLALSIGSLLPFIRDARGLDYDFCGLIVSLHSVGNLIASFAGGMLPVLIGRKKSILIFESFFAMAYLMIIFGRTDWVFAVAFLITGLARGAASNFCNAVINDLAPGKAWVINGLHAMFSVGAFLFPIILTLLTRSNSDNWIIACVFMLAMGILAWLLYALIPLDKDKEEKKKNGTNGFGFFKEPLFYLCITTLFFYLCAEQGVIGWMVTYFKDTGYIDAGLSQITASVLWLMILAGRLVTAWVSTRVEKRKLLPVMGVGLVVFFVLLILARNTGLILFGIMGFGFSMAGIYPTTVSFAGKLIQKYSMAWSFILTTASLGSIIMPSVIGMIAKSSGIAAGMSSIAAVVVIDLVCIIALTGYMARQEKI
ncbi:MAG: MFS transporter [Thermoflexaceae bacterium]|nr:MFS transporter [Thermoflexaceae bacterium]